MPFQGFEGPAGTGKTRHLTNAVLERFAVDRLPDHQHVLALTFMHGSRRRLDERLSGLAGLRSRFTCMTIDGLANHVVERWRSLAHTHHACHGDFSQTCNACGQLLEEPQIGKMGSREVSDTGGRRGSGVSPPRLRIIRALAPHVKLYLAADEFQCLDDEIDTAPFYGMVSHRPNHVSDADLAHFARRPIARRGSIARRHPASSCWPGVQN